jgi:CDP-diacylglycerol--glycerol-3-phosphate 3-phosphatidyltransferase
MFSTLANKLSLFRMILAPVFYVLLVSGEPLLRQISLAVFFVAALTDWYDGEIARRSGTVTNLGKFLDPLADKMLTSAAFIAFAVMDLIPWWMVAVIVLRDLVITLLRSLAERRDLHIVTSKAAQTKTFIQMTALDYVLLGVVALDTAWLRDSMGDVLRAMLDPAIVYALMLLVTVLTLFTGIQYFFNNWPVIKTSVAGSRPTPQ